MKFNSKLNSKQRDMIMRNNNSGQYGKKEIVGIPVSLQERWKRLQDTVDLSKKAKSYKKHIPTNVNFRSELREFEIFKETQKIASIHDKLQIRDITGATPNQYQSDVFRNRLYGKGLDKNHIFQHSQPKTIVNPQDYTPIKQIINKRTQRPLTLQLTHQYSDFSLPKLQYHQTKPQNIENVYQIQINSHKNVMQMQQPCNDSNSVKSCLPHRRLKTEADAHMKRSNIFCNNQLYSQQMTSSMLRKWSPTYLTDQMNPLLMKLSQFQ